MLLHRMLSLPLALLGLALASSRAEANGLVYLDDFTQEVTLTCSPTCTATQTGLPTASVLSGQRESTTTNATLSIASGVLDYQGDEGGGFLARYVFASPTNLAAYDNRFVFDVLLAENLLGNDVEVTVEDSVNPGTQKTATFTPILGPNSVFFADTDFNGIDFTQITEVKFGLTAEGAHLRLGAVLVPEPASASMLLLGLLGLARGGRTRRARAA